MAKHISLEDQISTKEKEKVDNFQKDAIDDKTFGVCPVCKARGLFLFSNIQDLEYESANLEHWKWALGAIFQNEALIMNPTADSSKGDTIADACFNCSTIFTAQY